MTWFWPRNTSQHWSIYVTTLQCVHLCWFVLELNTTPPTYSRGVASGWPCSHPDPPLASTYMDQCCFCSKKKKKKMMKSPSLPRLHHFPLSSLSYYLFLLHLTLPHSLCYFLVVCASLHHFFSTLHPHVSVLLQLQQFFFSFFFLLSLCVFNLRGARGGLGPRRGKVGNGERKRRERRGEREIIPADLHLWTHWNSGQMMMWGTEWGKEWGRASKTNSGGGGGGY